MCDNIGHTVSLISSEQGKLFGGYSSIPWTSPIATEWKKDDKAFIFSLTNRTKHVQVQNKQQALDHSKDYSVAFGRGHDFRISDNCNINNESYSNFGYTFSLPEGMVLNSDEAKSYLAGTYQYKVIEVEVYKVVFPTNMISSTSSTSLQKK